MEKIKNEIELFADRKNVTIDKIVLFGSQILGTANKDSDIDLLLVSKDFANKTYSQRIKKLLGLNRQLVKLTNKPFDILYYSDEEWANTSTLMIQEAKLNGKVIFEN
ncbi:MAG: nucleotidyltransferase domain-containing protein [Ignavibacteriae bacterium]|nr:nucleotidyltransferase domain-containing protein [Ignavibacteriota bacterium]